MSNNIPGSLTGGVTITLHTPNAIRLAHGREASKNKQQIVGLFRFASLSNNIVRAVGKDDPYADWFLLRIREALQDAETVITEISKSTARTLGVSATDVISIIKQLLDKQSNFKADELLAQIQTVVTTDEISIEIAHSVEPVKLELKFAHPYAYQAAYVLVDFDLMARQVLTARHIGKLDSDTAYTSLERAARKLRHAFALATAYKFTAVTREDMRQKNQRAEQAIKAMGECPDDVLNLSRTTLPKKQVSRFFSGIQAST